MAARGVYLVNFTNVTVSAVQDLFWLAPADDRPIELLAVYLSTTPGDMGDAQEEALRVDIYRGFTTVGSAGSSFTPLKALPNDSAAGFTARINDTTVATTSGVIYHSDAFNNRAGWVYIPTPETTIVASQVETSLVVRLNTAPGDSISLSGVAYVRELT